MRALSRSLVSVEQMGMPRSRGIHPMVCLPDGWLCWAAARRRAGGQAGRQAKRNATSSGTTSSPPPRQRLALRSRAGRHTAAVRRISRRTRMPCRRVGHLPVLHRQQPSPSPIRPAPLTGERLLILPTPTATWLWFVSDEQASL